MNLSPGEDQIGEDQMIVIADGLKDSVKSAAAEMLKAEKTIAPLLSPDGDPMLYMTTDKAQLRATFMSVDVESTTIFVGLRATTDGS